MSNARGEILLGIGEILWDIFPDGRRPGGAPANVAFHANQLGLSGVVCSRVGLDEMGAALRDFLRSRGLSDAHIQSDDEHATGVVTVEESTGDHPRYKIEPNRAYDYLEMTPELEAVARKSSALCFGTLAQRKDGTRETIHACIQAASKALIVFDVNLRQSWYTPQTIRRSLQCAHVVKMNEQEAKVIPALLELSAQDDLDLARILHRRFGVKTVCITRAERGCLLITEQEAVEVPGVPIRLADAVGAGDAFTAALVGALLRGEKLRSAGEIANRVGALVASKPGAMPDLREELKGI